MYDYFFNDIFFRFAQRISESHRLWRDDILGNP